MSRKNQRNREDHDVARRRRSLPTHYGPLAEHFFLGVADPDLNTREIHQATGRGLAPGYHTRKKTCSGNPTLLKAALLACQVYDLRIPDSSLRKHFS